MSHSAKVYTHLRQTNQDKKDATGNDTSAIRLTRREANQHTVDLHNERAEIIRVSKRECAQLLPATVLALRCLSDENYDTLAQMCSISPLEIITDLTRIPVEGALISRKALLTIFRALSPTDSEALQISSYHRDRSQAMNLLLTSYLRNLQSPLLESSSSSTVARMANMKERDLLVQNPNAFVGEIAHLVLEVLQLSDVSSPPKIFGPTEIAKIAWQVATLVGSSFVYATNCAIRLQKKTAAIKQRTAEAIDFLTTLGGMASSIGPAPGVVTDALSSAGGPLATIIADWLARPKKEFDLNSFAEDLAYLSDSIRIRSEKGLLVPGYSDSSLSTSSENMNSKDPSRIESDTRRATGEQFSEAFRICLANYKVHQLQHNLKLHVP